jgi:hypothetical protein
MVPCLLGMIALTGTAESSARGRVATSGAKVLDTDTRIDVNNMDMFVTNEGSFAYDESTGKPGLIFPRGTTNTAIFAAGIWLGASVEGVVRTSVAEYSMSFGPGTILPDGQPAPSGDPRFQVYRISSGGATGPDSVDYNNWPVADGAPVDADQRPQLIGDMTLWGVFNDLTRNDNPAASAEGLGVEVQQTTFAFNRTGSLGDVIFMKYKIINRGGNTLRDTYVSIWADPDLGGSSDDFVGCDTTLSLGYCYNATNTDNLYGSDPPAVGIDFFLGPVVPATEADSARVGDRWVRGFRNLPMTSFNKYTNGTDPDSPQATYNYQSGLESGGSVLRDPAGRITTFMDPGDPTKATGWLDDEAADKRMMLSSGPFTMAPGDTQIVVAAVVIGQGKDRLTSVTALKFNDLFAQAAFDANFQLPNPPERPLVTGVPGDGKIVLYWGERSEVGYHEPGYVFEGYNVYMGESVAGPWKRIFTYDLNDNIAFVFDDQFDLETGVVINKPVQFGTDTGITRRVAIDTDYNVGGGLRNGHPYFFGVTAYSYGALEAAGLKTLENSIDPIELVPEQPTAGVLQEDGTAGNLLLVQHVAGVSDGTIEAIVSDPARITGETYDISFGSDGEGVYWNLGRGDSLLLSTQRNQSGDGDYYVVDGIQWKVKNHDPGVRFHDAELQIPFIDQVATAGGVVPPDSVGGPGNLVWHDPSADGKWMVARGGGDGSVEGIFRIDEPGGDDLPNWGYGSVFIEFEYGNPQNIGWWGLDAGEVGPVPFKMYERDPFTGVERRLIPYLYSGGYTPGVWDFPDSGQVADAFSGWWVTDRIYAYTMAPGFTWEQFVADAADGTVDDDPRNAELFARLVFATPPDKQFVGADTLLTRPQMQQVLPGGTKVQFTVFNPNTPGDRFVIATHGLKFDPKVMKEDLSLIRVVPNPYFAHSAYEMNQFERVVKFTRMPPLATVRIFNIAGDLVRTLEKDNTGSSFLEWNLLTDRQLPVASGVYIYHIEAKDAAGKSVGTVTGRVAVFIEKERLNTF